VRKDIGFSWRSTNADLEPPRAFEVPRSEAEKKPLASREPAGCDGARRGDDAYPRRYSEEPQRRHVASC